MEKMIQKTVTNTHITAAMIEGGEVEILGTTIIKGVRAGIDAAAKRVRLEYGDKAVVMDMSYFTTCYKMPLDKFVEYAEEVSIEMED